MKITLKKIKRNLAQFAIIRSVYFLLIWIYKFPGYIMQYITFKKLAKSEKRFLMSILNLFPRLFDNTGKTPFDPHYTYHPAWAARIVAQLKPQKHIDVSSVLHFSTLVSAFIPVDFYDYRPAEVHLSNLGCKSGDLNNLPFPDNSVESISCMHTVEHIGLGRYGDKIDPNGDKKSTQELTRVVKKGGSLIFVVPVGESKIYFNAHRIYSYEQVIALFPGMSVHEFSLVPDDFKTHGLIKNANPDMVKDQKYACGCFWFIKK